MTRGRPSFSTDSDGEGDLSRSTSRERDSVGEARQHALPLPGATPRKSSFSTVVNIPQAVSEVDDYHESDAFLAHESDAFLPHSLDHPSPRRRGQSYGSFAPGHDHYIAPRFVNVATPQPGLGRSESVFKVRPCEPEALDRLG